MASAPSSLRRLLLVAVAIVSIFGGGALVPAQNENGVPGGSPTGNSLNFFNTPVNSILDYYEQLSGKRLIRDTNLAQAPPISINATGVNKAEQLKMIEEALLLNGVAFVPVDENTLKVITLGTNKNPRSEGVKLYANAADLPDGDQVVSYYMPLDYISPLEAQNIFTQNAPVHTYGAYVPAPSAQAIILTENASVIRQLIALKELIDVPPAQVVSEFVQLNRADAEKVADLLTKLLDNKSAAGAAAPGQPGGGVFVPADLGNTEPLSNEHNLLSGDAQIVPDTRSNRLLVITRPVNMPFLKQLIAQLDQPDIFMVPQRRPLKYVLAEDILPALEAALAQGKDEEDEIKSEQTKTSTTQTPTSQGSPSSSAGVSSGGTGSVTAITPQLQTPSENDVPTVVSIGKTRLLADNRSNSIIVFGSPDVVSRVFDMIDQLDRKPLQVYLATVIGELTVTQGQEFGIDILQKFQSVGSGGLASSNINTSTSTGANGAASVPEPGSLISSTGFPLLAGLNLYGAIGSTLDAYLRALETTSRFKVISRPSVYTTNNKLAVIASGSQVPVLSNIASSFAGGTTSTTNSNLVSTGSIQYEDVLLQLDIIPLINADHEVTLQIRQTNNTLGAENSISGNDVPTINTQEINTVVTVPDKSTVVIGGLISDTTKHNTSGVPWLSDIPGLGYLFKDTTKSTERDELIIMIQPTVVETDAQQIAANEAEEQRTILGKEAIAAAGATTTTVTKTVTVRTSASDAALRIPAINAETSTTTVSTKRSAESTGTIPITAPAPAPAPAPASTPTAGPGVQQEIPPSSNDTTP
jgi:type II secretion system protein D